MKKLLALSTIAFASTLSAFAAEPVDAGNQWEVSGATALGLGIFRIGPDEDSGARTHFTMTVTTLVGYVLDNGLEPSLSAGLDLLSGENGFTSYQVLAGPIYNFDTDTLNSFFATGRVGINLFNSRSSFSLFDGTTVGSSVTYLTFAYLAGFGKRLQLTNHISWKPEFDFFGHTASTKPSGSKLPTEMTWAAVPVQFTMIF